jgi:predicted DNA-binding transcriptional regulator YafY
MDMSTVVGMIHEAGRRQVCLQLTYDGVSRLVEPYSMREKMTGRLFYGYCSVHSRIHSFRVEKIARCEVTNLQFSPRWEVEF